MMETLRNGALPCFGCGLVAVPRREAGPQPGEHRKAVCSGCGRYLKWLPKVSEGCMQASVNRVILLGTIGKYGVTVSYVGQGTPRAAFSLVVSEVGQDGKEYATFVECEVWGKKAEAAGEIDAGCLVVFEGKLRKRQNKNQQWELIVSGFDVMPIATELAGTTDAAD